MLYTSYTITEESTKQKDKNEQQETVLQKVRKKVIALPCTVLDFLLETCTLSNGVVALVVCPFFFYKWATVGRVILGEKYSNRASAATGILALYSIIKSIQKKDPGILFSTISLAGLTIGLYKKPVRRIIYILPTRVYPEDRQPLPPPPTLTASPPDIISEA